MTSDRFLITGLPRTRSAWFTALFLALGVDACHESAARFDSLETFEAWLRQPGLKGWCDPSAACLVPEFAAKLFDGRPIVIVERHPEESCKSLQQWSGLNLLGFGAITSRYERFKSLAGDALSVRYEDLDRYTVVREIVKHCTGIELPYDLWRTFDLLKVEQYMQKARAA